MRISIDPSDLRPIYAQIMDEIRRSIVLRILKAGDPLPAVRQLAVDLRVNPNTVAQAYRELERSGVVYVRRGLGTYVADTAFSHEERRTLVRAVANRALIDAYRHGIGADELADAIYEAADFGVSLPASVDS